MSTMFRKTAAGRKPRKPRKPPGPRKTHVAPAKPKVDEPKTPVTRVGDGRDHHDTIATRVLRVLVDQSKEPESSVSLGEGSKSWPMQFTTNAEPLAGTILVFALTFEHVADSGKLTLTYRHNGSPWDIHLFKGIDIKDLFINDPDWQVAPEAPEAPEPPSRQMLDYQTVPPFPISVDPDLDGMDPPLVSLMDTGS